MSEIQLKPCPFCGNADQDDMIVAHTSSWWVSCEQCGAEGITENSHDEAIMSWNKRRPDHERCKQELLGLLKEWSGTGIADCHCWNTDLRKRTDAALEAK